MKVIHRAANKDLKEMFRIIKHVLDTRDLELKIQPKILNALIWNLVQWSDSDWGADKDNRKSVSGACLFVCGVLVAWRSKQQKAVALSNNPGV